MKQDYLGEIISKNKISKNVFEIQIKSDLKSAKAGQFISIKCPNTTLRRPFSIANFDKNSQILTILFKLKGEGTNYLKNLEKTNNIQFLAPLGNGFNILNKKSLLVGAGIGIAPMLFLKKELNERKIENYLISGFKENSEIIQGSDENIVGGSVLDNLEKIIDDKNIEVVYSCGPKIVLKNIALLAKRKNIQSQIAMEKEMACSIGVCRGCVIKLNINNEVVTKAVCKDGPVFEGAEVIWE